MMGIPTSRAILISLWSNVTVHVASLGGESLHWNSRTKQTNFACHHIDGNHQTKKKKVTFSLDEVLWLASGHLFLIIGDEICLFTHLNLFKMQSAV